MGISASAFGGMGFVAGGAHQCCDLQNRELQIMRIVRHPNIVELKAFYYSNGERVSLIASIRSLKCG
jgi:hypothetical protein